MATDNVSVFLSSGGDDRSLALAKFSGEVLVSFRVNTVFYDNRNTIVSYKMVDEGKSWQFPILGDDPAPEYHTTGTELLGQQQLYQAVTLTPDDILVGHRSVGIDQIKMSHFDTIGQYGRAIGRGLAIDIDSKIIRVAILAARTSASAGYYPGGNVVYRAATGTTYADAFPATAAGAFNFRDDAAQLAQLMDEDNVPRDGRYLFIPPYFVRVLTKDSGSYFSFGTGPANTGFSTSGTSTLFSADYGSGNDINRRVIGVLEGFNVIVSNNFPANANVTTGNPPSNTTKYNVDNRYVVSGSNGQACAIALCGASEGSGAVGMVEFMGIQPWMQRNEYKNVEFMKAQTFFGLGVVAPWKAGIIQARNAA